MSRALGCVLALGAAIALAGCGDDGDDPDSLAGSSWVLVDGIDVPAGAMVTMPTAAFASEEVTGTGGCNRFATTYTVDDDEIEIGPIASTQIACSEPAGRIEADFFAALDQVAEWDVDDGELVLSDADDAELLRFEPAPTS